MKQLSIFLGLMACSTSVIGSQDPYYEALMLYNSKAMKILLMEDLRETDDAVQELLSDVRAKSKLLPMPLFSEAYEISTDYPEYLKFVGSVLNHDIKGLILNSYELGSDIDSGCVKEVKAQIEDNHYSVSVTCPVYNYGNVKWLKPTDVVTDKYSFFAHDSGFVLEDIELGVVEYFKFKTQSLIKELQAYDESKA
ncbi:TPA: hypothetical protein I7730_01760 [Vibrio vulnificus]|uniref:Uncharacterized protein n=1 Tax=Vibrio vulnificus TaxID=672 RepID=A0A8H9K5N9_VIBVL|nr:hypothetical protein [Vibrio vulnificus]HAS8538510.1 hypothetical protein [Vibrio vulnificus]